MGLHGKRSHDTIRTHVLAGGKVMERIRGYRYRAYPNKAQREFFEKTFGCCRFVYNHYLEAKKNLWKEWRDTLTLSPSERSVSVHFAAIDYNSPGMVRHAFRLIPSSSKKDDIPWNHIGTDRTITLLDLPPGCYVLEIRCTDSDGQWVGNIRSLTLMVTPTFWESTTGRLLITLIALLIL